MIMKGKKLDLVDIFKLFERSNISQFIMYTNSMKMVDNVDRNVEVLGSRVFDLTVVQSNQNDSRRFISHLIEESTCRKNHTKLLCEWELWL